MNSASRRFLGGALLTLLVLLLSACTAHEKPSLVETAFSNAAKDVVIPFETEDLKNPIPDNEQAVSEGQQVYLQSCAICHGTDGHGQTTLGQGMYPPATDLTSPHVQHWNDSQMFWIIQNGVRLTGMASWKGAISPDDTWKLVNFIRHLPQLNAVEIKNAQKQVSPTKTPEELNAYGKVLYRQEGCFICHRLNGEGKKVGPDLTGEGNRGRTTDWLIGHFKKPSAYVRGSVMPAYNNLTDEQLTALASFLESQKGSRGFFHLGR